MMIPAIKYVGNWADHSGMGEASRNYILALNKAGVDLSTERISHVSEFADYGEGYELASQLENRDNNYKVKIVHMTGNLFLNYLEPLKYHIAHLFWEVDRMDKEWVWNTNLADEVWTGSEYTKNALVKSGVNKPIYIFPQPVKVIHEEILEPVKLPGHKGTLFYSIFQLIERKNPKTLIKAYLEEFQDHDDVSLLIKTFGLNYSTEETEKIKKDIDTWKKEFNLPKNPRIYLDCALHNQHDMHRLHKSGDIFVSPHRGEGWGIPLAEAMVMGNPVITTGLGGITEWLNKDTAHLIKFKMINVFNMNYVPWYNEEQKWADVDIMDLRGKMRHFYEHPEIAKEMGQKAQEMVRNSFNYETVGNQLAGRLNEIGTELAK